MTNSQEFWKKVEMGKHIYTDADIKAAGWFKFWIGMGIGVVVGGVALMIASAVWLNYIEP